MSPGALMLRLFAAAVAAWLLAPTLVVIPLSLTGEASFIFPPKSWSVRWFENLFGDEQWRASLLMSIRVSVIVAALSVVVGTACALGLARSRMRGIGVLRAVLIAPLIVPLVITAVGIYAVFLPWGLTGGTIGFVLGHTVLGIPFVVITVSASLARVDGRLEQAAATLGASPPTVFFTVTLPLIAAGVAAGGVFAFMVSFDEVVIALFISDPFVRTLPVQMYVSLQAIDPTMAAASTLLFLVTTSVTLVAIVFSKDVRERTL